MATDTGKKEKKVLTPEEKAAKDAIKARQEKRAGLEKDITALKTMIASRLDMFDKYIKGTANEEAFSAETDAIQETLHAKQADLDAMGIKSTITDEWFKNEPVFDLPDGVQFADGAILAVKDGKVYAAEMERINPYDKTTKCPLSLYYKGIEKGKPEKATDSADKGEETDQAAKTGTDK